MKSKVVCKNLKHGEHSFFLDAYNQEYFLFTQGFNENVKKYFGLEGVLIDKLVGAKSIKPVLHKTFKRIIRSVGEIEKENCIVILDKTAKKFNLGNHKKGKNNRKIAYDEQLA